MDKLKIYIDRLKEGRSEVVSESLLPTFFNLDDTELHFSQPVQLSGEVYSASDHLVIHLDIKTSVLLPCAICNEEVEHPITIDGLYLTQPLQEIKGATYDLTADVRASILLQTPSFTECQGGKCPERKSIQQYLSNQTPHSDRFPFADLS